METVFQATGLQKRYGHAKALSGLNMSIPKGSIYGIVGKNGAGKTTLIRLLCGLQEPTAGEYTLYGISCRSRQIGKARRRTGAVVETPSFSPEYTAEENIRQQYRILGMPSFDGIGELLELVGLSDTGKKKARDFSLGMRQRLGIAIALAGSPDFLILDEPTNGLDPQGIIDIRELILKLNHEQDITVLISSHNLDELSRLATHFGFIDSGRMVREVTADDLRAACRKCIRATVSDVKILCRVLDEAGLEYDVLSDTEADIYGSISVTQLTLRLSERGCELNTLRERDESLESYYINLVGGAKE